MLCQPTPVSFTHYQSPLLIFHIATYIDIVAIFTVSAYRTSQFFSISPHASMGRGEHTWTLSCNLCYSSMLYHYKPPHNDSCHINKSLVVSTKVKDIGIPTFHQVPISPIYTHLWTLTNDKIVMSFTRLFEYFQPHKFQLKSISHIYNKSLRGLQHDEGWLHWFYNKLFIN